MLNHNPLQMFLIGLRLTGLTSGWLYSVHHFSIPAFQSLRLWPISIFDNANDGSINLLLSCRNPNRETAIDRFCLPSLQAGPCLPLSFSVRLKTPCLIRKPCQPKLEKLFRKQSDWIALVQQSRTQSCRPNSLS